MFIKRFLCRYPTILDRYIGRQFIGPFLLAVGGFAIIGLVDILFSLVDLAVLSRVPLLVVTKLLIYRLPGIMVIFFPMAVLFSVMLMLVRMAKDNELTVLKTSGVHTLRLITPFFLLCLFVTGVSYFLNERMVPWSNRAAESLIKVQIQQIPPPDIVEDVVFKEGDRFFYIKRVDAKHGDMSQLLIFEKGVHFPRLTTAKRAVWRDRAWTLYEGMIQDVDEDGAIRFSDHFSEMVIHVDQSIESFYSPPKSPREMDSKELKTKIDQYTKSGLGTRTLKVEYHMKKSIPMACLIFGIVGMAVCLSLVKSGADWVGVVVAICLSVLAVGLYFFMVAICRSFAKDGQLTAILGAWLPNIVYGTVGLGTLFYQSIIKP